MSLLERLVRTKEIGPKVRSAYVTADGKSHVEYHYVPMVFVNPDGPAAIAEIVCLRDRIESIPEEMRIKIELAIREYASKHGPSGQALNISGILDCIRNVR